MLNIDVRRLNLILIEFKARLLGMLNIDVRRPYKTNNKSNKGFARYVEYRC